MFKRVEVQSDLVTRLREGDERAFRAIYDLLHKRVYRMLFSIIKNTEQTEELTQEAFTILWLNREKLDPSQTLYPYIYLTSRRLAIDHLRKVVTETSAKNYLSKYLNEECNVTEEMLAVAELNHLTEEVVKSLPKQQQTVFVLSRIEGLSYAEIANNLQISQNTVKNHLVAALKTLRVHFSKNDIIYLYFLYYLAS